MIPQWKMMILLLKNDDFSIENDDFVQVTTHLYRNNLSTVPFFNGLAEEIMLKLCRGVYQK